jgi:glucose/mannose-6-phosphate isomerase
VRAGLPELTPEAVAALDPQGMAAAIAAQADHIEQGWSAAWEAAAAVPHWPTALPCGPAVHAHGFDGVVVTGMGGSAIGADFVRAALPELAVPYEVVRGYEPPAWVDPCTLLVAVSYSGNTEETLACVHAAHERGAGVVAVASGGTLAALAQERGWPLIVVPGGLQPRAAVGYLLTALAAALARSGLATGLPEQVTETGGLLRVMAAELGPEVPEPYNAAKAIARRLVGRLPVIYGAGLTAPAARRWKSGLNENGKSPAVFAELPELCHNEIVGWEGDPALLERLHVVVLEDPLEDPRLRRRWEPTLAGARARAAGVDVVAARGASPLARVCSAAYLGDWVSLYLAILNGVDPTPVVAIERLKRTLADAPPA